MTDHRATVRQNLNPPAAMTDAPLTREEAERLLALCEAATASPWSSYGSAPGPWAVHAEPQLPWPLIVAFDVPHWADAELVAAARTALPRALHEVLRLQAEISDLREIQVAYVDAMCELRGQSSDQNLAGKIRELRAETADELDRWRKLQPDLDRLSALLDVCEGISPISVAVAEIERLRAEDDFDFEYEPVPPKVVKRRLMVSAEKYDEVVEEVARLRRALDAAGIVLEDEG